VSLAGDRQCLIWTPRHRSLRFMLKRPSGRSLGTHASATQHQRAVDRVTSLLDRASFVAVLTILVISWVSLNCLAVALGYNAIDPHPFAWLSGAVS
jgi:uncharacterized membrane protein